MPTTSFLSSARRGCGKSQRENVRRLSRAARLGAVLVILACGHASVRAQDIPLEEPPPTQAAPVATAPTPSATQPAPEARTGVPLSDIKAAGSSPAEATAELPPEARAHLEAARTHMTAQQYEPAAAQLEIALRMAPAITFDLALALARLKQAQGRLGEARLAAERAVSFRRGSAAAHLLLAGIERQLGHTDAAIAHFRSAALAAEEPDHPRVTLAWWQLGETLADAGYPRAAAEAFAEFDRVVFSTHPDDAADAEIAAILKAQPYGALERRLALLATAGLPEERVAAVRAAQERRFDEPYLERLYARTLLETGHAADAFEFCLARVMQAAQSWDAGAAEEPRAAGLLALTLESGRATGGLAAWIEQVAAEAAAGRSLELARRLARRLSADGDYTAARPLWRALTQVQPESADDAWHYASALRDSGDLVAALDALTEFVRAREDGAGITPERLAAWMRSFRSTNEFLRTVEERAARAAGDYAASTVLGMTAAAAGQVELAERLLGAAVAARPDNAALAELAWARMLLASYRWEETLAHAEKALAAAPHLAAAHLAKAEAYTGLDQTADAEQAYKAALAAQPDHADYLAALARHYRRAGNTLAAQRYYQQAWLADHTQAEALEELIDSYVEEQKLEVARNCLKQAEASDVPEDTLRRIRTTLAHVGTTAEEHRAELQRQFEAHPEDFLTGLRLATALYLAHEPAAALRVLERIRDLKPDDERLIFVQVRVHLRLVEREPAIALLTEQVRRYPNRRPLLRTLADACIADFRFDEGRRTLERMLVLPGTPEQRQEVRNALLATWLELGDYGPALELLDEWLTAEPDSAALHQAKIRVLLEAKRYEEAVVLAEAQMTPAAERWAAVRARYQQVFDEVRARTAAGEDTQSQEQALERELRGPLNNLYERRGDYVQACMAARRFAELERQLRAWQADEPEQTQLTEWLVALLIETQDADGASAALGKLVPKTPAEVLRALLWRARITAADHPAGALEQLANLLKEGYVKDNIATRNEVQSEIIQVLIGSGDYTRALELCESWAAATSQADLLGRYMVLRLKRFVLGAAGRLDEQMAVAEQMLALQPHEPGLNNDVGYTWIDRGEQLDRAFEMIRLAVAAEPLNAAFLDSLGWAYYKRGDFAAARTQLERAVRLREGQDATVYDHLGDAAYRLKDQRAAREYWGKALELAEAPEPDVQPATQTAPASRPGAASQPGAASAPTRQEPAARQEPRPPLVNEAQLIAALRTKLAALERGETPRVAPVATVAPGTGQ